MSPTTEHKQQVPKGTEEDEMPTVIAVLIVVMLAVIVLQRLVYGRCRRCGSYLTFNWSCGTYDTHLHIMRTNINQYCFVCGDRTIHDDFGNDHVFRTLRWRIAVQHHNKHHPEDIWRRVILGWWQ